MGLHREAEHTAARRIALHFQFAAVVKIEVARPGIVRDLHLLSVNVVFIAVDDGPHRLVRERPAAGVNAVVVSGIERLPIGSDQEGRYSAFDSRYAASRFRIAGRDSVPDSPNIFPTLPANSVEEGKLQIAGFVAIPAIGDVDHVAGLEPLVFVHEWSERELILILAPGHHVPGKRLVSRAI